MGTETTSTEPLNIVVNESDTRSRKCNQLYTGGKSSNFNGTETSQYKWGTNRKNTLIVGASIAKDIEVWRLIKRMKFSVIFNITADLDLKRDSENLYDKPASAYNIKKKNSRSPKYFGN